METVDKIKDTQVAPHPAIPGGKVPVEPVIIKSVRLISAFDREQVEAQVKAAEQGAEAQQQSALKDVIDKIEKEAGAKMVTTGSGLMYVNLKVGEGASPHPTDRVEVHYTGWLVDGTKFDSSRDRGSPSRFGLNRVIKGWTEGVGSMKVGGQRKFVIPPKLAYGARGRPGIPGNATLIFEVELLSIE